MECNLFSGHSLSFQLHRAPGSMRAEIGFADLYCFCQYCHQLHISQTLPKSLERQSLLRLNWPEHLDSICMSLRAQPKMQRKEFGWSRGGMVSGTILKSVAAFKEKRRSNSM